MSTAVLDPATAAWLTLDEVAALLRFPTRKALLAHLRRHPVPVYQRVGGQRYFMKVEDVQGMMAPLDRAAVLTRRDVLTEGDTMREVPPPQRKAKRPAKTARRRR